jgi:hypothetical protein
MLNHRKHRSIVQTLLISSTFITAIPFAQAQTIPSALFLPNSNSSLGDLGGLFGNSNSISTPPFIGNNGGSIDLGTLLGNRDPIESLLGGITNGGAFGRDLNLGGLLGGNGGGNIGGDLVSILQSYLQKFIQMATNAIGLGGNGNDAATNPGLGDTLAHVEAAIKSNTGGLALPDVGQARVDALKGKPANLIVNTPFSGINLSTMQPGQITLRTTTAFNQTVLGKDAQERHLKAMDAIQKSMGGTNQISQGSTQIAGQVGQFSQQSGQVAQKLGAIAQTSSSSASNAVKLGQQAKSAISTQDVVKFQSQQYGELGNILAGVSNQLAGSSNQLAVVSSELAGLSSQSAQQAGQLKEVAAINGDQAVSLRSMQVGQAVANSNLSDLNQGQQGDRQRKLLEDQAEVMVLGFSQGFRVSR